MKLVVARADLLTAFDRVSRIAKPGHHPILETVSLTAGEGALGIEGTDLDVEVRVACPAEVEEAGAATVPADAFYKLLKRLPEGELRLDLLDDGRIRVKSKRSQVHFPSLKPDDMPIFLSASPSHVFQVSGTELARLLGVAFAAADNVSQGYLCGVCLHADDAGQQLCCVATDTHVLARASAALPDGAVAMPRVILALKAATEIAKLAEAAGDGLVTLSLSKEMIEADALGTRIRSKLVEGTYPAYERVLPAGEAPTIDVVSGELGAAFKRALIVIGDGNSNGVRCAIADGSMAISTTGKNGSEILEQIDVDEGVSHTLNISAKLAGSVLEALSGDVAQIALHEAPKGSIWRRPGDANLFCYLMPMRG